MSSQNDKRKALYIHCLADNNLQEIINLFEEAPVSLQG